MDIDTVELAVVVADAAVVLGVVLAEADGQHASP